MPQTAIAASILNVIRRMLGKINRLGYIVSELQAAAADCDAGNRTPVEAQRAIRR